MYDIFVVKNNELDDRVLEQFPHAKIVEYDSNRIRLFKDIAKQSVTEHAWVISDNCDYSDFDFDYQPPWHQNQQMHVWPTNQQYQGGNTVLLNVQEFLKQADTIDAAQNYKDISWKDHSLKESIQPEIFVWGQDNDTGITDAQVMRYVGSHLDMMRKTIQKAKTPYIWVIGDKLNYSDFDFSWRPDWAEETFLHVWPTENQNLGGDTFYVNVDEFKHQQEIDSLELYQTIQWHKKSIAQLAEPEIFVWQNSNDGQFVEQNPCAIPLRSVGSKFDMMNRTVQKASTPYIWVVSGECDYNDFDFGWRPGWAEETFLHVWPTENQTNGGDTLYVNTVEFKKQSIEIEKLEQYNVIAWHKESVKQSTSVDVVIWDRGNRTQIDSLKQQHPNAIVLRYVGNHLEMMKKSVSKTSSNYIWVIGDNIDYNEFDFNWRPDWATESHLHVWSTKDQGKSGDTFYINVNEFKKQSIELERLDYYDAVTWHKDSVKQLKKSDVVIWDQGNQDQVDALKQQHPNAIVLRYVGNHLEMMRKTTSKVSTPSAWVISTGLDYNDFNFDWRPDWATETHLHVWPTENQNKGGDTFYVNTAEFKKQSIDLERLDYYDAVTWHRDQPIEQTQTPDVVIWNHGNQEQVELLKQQHPNAIVLRYVGNHLEMMKKSVSKTSTSNAWVISTDFCYNDFDFDWRPDWATESHLHVWSTKDQGKSGDTFYVNTTEFKKQSIDLERLDYYDAVTWHRDQPIEQTQTPDVVIWNHGNQEQVELLKQQHPNAIVLRYVGNHLEMMKKSVSKTSTSNAWVISTGLDYNDFNFDWRPDWATETHLHVWPTENQNKGGDTFYVNTVEFKKQGIELERLDYYDAVTWHKDLITQLIPDNIVIWNHGNQEQVDALKQQHPDAVVLRYVGNHLEMMKKSVSKTSSNYIWVIGDNIDYSSFDFKWKSSWAEETHLHVWPTENQNKGGDTFYVNTTEFKKQSIDLERLDYYDAVTWHRDQTLEQIQTPDVVIWNHGNQEQVDALKQQHPDAVVLRYVGNHLEMMKKSVSKTSTSNAWVISTGLDYNEFDFDWRPDWATESHLHVWTTEDQTKGGDTFYVNTVEFKKQSIELERLDYYDAVTWHKDQPLEQIQTPDVVIWNHGNQEQVDALKQQHPGAIVLRYVGNHLEMMKKSVSKTSTSNAWVISTGLDYSNFNFNWRPDWATESHLHVWTTEDQTKGGDTFYVNTVEFKKQSIDLERLDYYDAVTWHKESLTQLQTPDVVIWDNGSNNGNLEYLKIQYPNAKVLRNIGNRFEMMKRTMRHVESSYAWVINSKCSYTDFNFNWRPDWATETHLHVWPTENQTKGGDTFYVNTNEFKKQSIEIENIEYYDAVTWHKESVNLASEVDVIVWSFGGNQENLSRIKEQYPAAKTLRYIGTHLEMLKKSAKYTDSENFWVLSDCCDYGEFNQNWKPDWETENSIHCWASGSQEFGDTFYVPKTKFLVEASDIEKLEYYSSIIWYQDGYPRLPWPVNHVKDNDLYSAITSHQFQSMYEYFVAPGSKLGSAADPSLWEKRHLIAYNKNGHVSLCPRDAIGSISGKLLSYPYIQYHKCEKSTQKSQDIVFISYDEKDADLNWKKLKDQQPAATRLHGIDGMINALKVAANNSNTPWFYAVFAKTEVADDFNFDFNPDYLDTPGNYIFQAYNRITDYTYGHGSVLLYHSKTVSEATSWGYDFTTSFPYTHIPILSCYNDAKTPWEAWRTSFREVLKLKEMNTVESQYRMQKWLTVGNGPVGKWSMCGAQDAVEYSGSLEEANNWNWLNQYFTKKHLQHQ